MIGYNIDFITLHFVLEYYGELFYLSITKLGGHLLNLVAVQIQFLGDMFIRQVQAHKIKAQYPDLEGLMVPSEDSIRQIIEAFLILFTLITLSSRLLLTETFSDDSHGITKRKMYAFRPKQFAHSLIDTGHHLSSLLCLPAFVGVLIMGREK
jgi:hypothetical protein